MPLALTALAMLVVIAAVFLAMGLWELRWQRRLVKLSNKLNNQAFQTLRGLPKLRVAAAETFAYAAWASEFARSRELQQRAGRIKNLTHGRSTWSICRSCSLPVHAAGRPGPGSPVGRAGSSPSTPP